MRAIGDALAAIFLIFSFMLLIIIWEREPTSDDVKSGKMFELQDNIYKCEQVKELEDGE